MSAGRADARGIVLVVDDSPHTLAMLIDALEDGGLTTLVARDGLAALELLDRIEPDLILLDAVMPGIDGFETCRRIKQRPDMATTPVIFMTGLSDRAHVAEALRAGGVDYVTKPVAPDELIARISVHLVNAQMIADARRALDAAGRAVAALRPDAAASWASPRARSLLGRLPDAAQWRAPLQTWLAAMSREALSQSADLVVATPDGGSLKFIAIGRAVSGDILVRVAAATADPGALLARKLAISLREGEVLAWLARGKSNRDIAEILGLSPRTITKHVEQILAKLGVENRTSAAALAIRVIDHA